MQKITPFLWFDGRIEEAARFYASVFRDARVVDADERKAHLVVEGQELILFNGGPHFTHSPAFSLYVDCDTQAEVDELWEKLLAGGGAPSRCGWLTDRFGVSWQIIPSVLPELLGDRDEAKAARVHDAMMGMVKIDAVALRAAYDAA